MTQSWEQIDEGWGEPPDLSTATVTPPQEPRPKRTRARGKQKRSVERAAALPKPTATRTRKCTATGKLEAGARGQGRPTAARAARLPSWVTPVAVLVAAIGVFVLALIAAAH